MSNLKTMRNIAQKLTFTSKGETIHFKPPGFITVTEKILADPELAFSIFQTVKGGGNLFGAFAKFPSFLRWSIKQALMRIENGLSEDQEAVIDDFVEDMGFDEVHDTGAILFAAWFPGGAEDTKKKLEGLLEKITLTMSSMKEDEEAPADEASGSTTPVS